MQRLGQGIKRTIFWSYERGSWPYDVMVLTIIAFVLLTPKSWFNDQPQAVDVGSSGVQLLSEDSENKTRTYRLDASTLSSEKRVTKTTPELERETHDILGRKVEELKDQRFRIVQIDPTLSGDGSVLYYNITIIL